MLVRHRLLRAVILAVVALSPLLLRAQEWRSVGPRGFIGQALVYDAARARLVLVGAVAGSGNLQTWEHDGLRWLPIATANAPPTRQQWSMAYDFLRSRTVLFGGFSAQTLADTWEYDGTSWILRQTLHSPPARFAHALAHDLWRSRIVMFGGSTGLVTLQDTWHYDGVDWQQATTTVSPAVQPGPLLAFDLQRGRTVMFASNGGGTWEYDGLDWLPIPTAALLPRAGAAMALDASSGRVVLFGGTDGNQNFFDDTWEYDGTNWQQVAVAVRPQHRQGHAMAYDFARARVVLFGGQSFTLAQPNNDTWAYGSAGWSRWQAGTVVPERHGHAMAHDPHRARTILFGGAGVQLLGDTWEHDGVRWTAVVPSGAPPPRMNHSLVMDTARARAVLFGGFPTWNDTWEYDGASWVQRTTTTTPPWRARQAAAYDPARGRVVMFGGWYGATLGDTWEYDGIDWRQVVLATAPSARAVAAMAYDASRGRTVLFGGINYAPAVIYGDTWEYTGTAWQLAAPATSPGPRYEHALAYDEHRGRIVLFGGMASVPLDETWEYDGVRWSPLAVVDKPPSRSRTALAYDRVRRNVLLVGGQAMLNVHDDSWTLLPAPIASWTRYGLGCAGSGGTPELAPQPPAMPALGTTLPLGLTHAPPSAGLAVLLFGFGITAWNGVPLPQALDPFGLPGCRLWIEPVPGAAVLLAHPGNAVVHGLAIPAQPSLAGVVLAVQALTLDAFAANGLGAVSNGVILRLH